MIRKAVEFVIAGLIVVMLVLSITFIRHPVVLLILTTQLVLAFLLVYLLFEPTKYKTASQPRLSREETIFKIAQDISRVSDMQGILALVFSVTFAGAIIFALVKATTTEAMTAVIQVLVPLVSAIVGFYFGRKTAEGAA